MIAFRLLDAGCGHMHASSILDTFEFLRADAPIGEQLLEHIK